MTPSDQPDRELALRDPRHTALVLRLVTGVGRQLGAGRTVAAGARELAVLCGLERPSPLASRLLAAHRRWSALGCPDEGWEDVPLTSRIVTVCDAYARMLRARGDRPALAPDGALTVICGAAGGRFCPEVCAALVLLVQALPGLCAHEPLGSAPRCAPVPPRRVRPRARVRDRRHGRSRGASFCG